MSARTDTVTEKGTARIIYRCLCGHRARADFPTTTTREFFARSDSSQGERLERVFHEPGRPDSFWVPGRRCRKCGSMMARLPVEGSYAPGVRCIAACRKAVGAACACSCAGANHGIAWLEA